ncbi:MAG: hypothetical protein VKP57_08280 [Candidatus Sericytochromatia bacterium]|nr:hypothetical protein [Candidatus Sericytochromatia bacterium]
MARDVRGVSVAWRARLARVWDMVGWAVLAYLLWRLLGPRESAGMEGVTGVREVVDLPRGRPAVVEVATHT